MRKAARSSQDVVVAAVAAVEVEAEAVWNFAAQLVGRFLVRASGVSVVLYAVVELRLDQVRRAIGQRIGGRGRRLVGGSGEC